MNMEVGEIREPSEMELGIGASGLEDWEDGEAEIEAWREARVRGNYDPPADEDNEDVDQDREDEGD